MVREKRRAHPESPRKAPQSLTEAREIRKKTQADIAVELGKTQATVSNWETGVTSPPPALWLSIADAYGLEVIDLPWARLLR